ncbi:MAG TPA: MFS transporter [Acidimicrobiales bacterium]
MSRLASAGANTFRSLRVRNYKLFFFGQLVSVCGTWMQTIAQAWLVLRLSHDSGVAVGVVTALQFTPTLLFGMWGGVIADRFDKRRLLVGTQLAMTAAAAALATLTLTGAVQLWHVYALALVTGLATAVNAPAHQSFVVEMVGPQDVGNAVGLNSAGFNAGRIVGPALAGLVIVTVGTGWCFAVNAASFVAAIGGLMAMRPGELWRGAPVARAKGQVREGFRYVRRTPELRSNVILLTIVGTLAYNFQVVIPILAKVTFHGSAGTYSAMTVAMGSGSLVGALLAASRRRPSGELLFGASLAFGAANCLAAVSPNLVTVLPALVLLGLCSITYVSTANTLLQLRSDAEMRGRVMAIYALVVIGSTPIGGPLLGWICQQWGARWGLGLGGLSTLAGAVFFGTSLLRQRRLGGGMDRDLVGEPAAA